MLGGFRRYEHERQSISWVVSSVMNAKELIQYLYKCLTCLPCTKEIMVKYGICQFVP